MKCAFLGLFIACFAAGCDPSQAAINLGKREPSLFAPGRSCSRGADQALAHGIELERTAAAHWQRAPFASEEAPQAAVDLAEAEACFASAGERMAKLRVQSKRRAYVQEVLRRFARARLNLEVAVRRGELERAKHEAEQMLALLSHSQDQSFRQSILDVVRRLTAQIAERSGR